MLSSAVIHMWHNFLHKPVLQLLSSNYTIYFPSHCRSAHTWATPCTGVFKFLVTVIPTDTPILILGDSKRMSLLLAKALGSFNSSPSSNDPDFHHLSHSLPWSCPETLPGFNFNPPTLLPSIRCFLIPMVLLGDATHSCYRLSTVCLLKVHHPLAPPPPLLFSCVFTEAWQIPARFNPVLPSPWSFLNTFQLGFHPLGPPCCQVQRSILSPHLTLGNVWQHACCSLPLPSNALSTILTGLSASAAFAGSSSLQTPGSILGPYSHLHFCPVLKTHRVKCLHSRSTSTAAGQCECNTPNTQLLNISPSQHFCPTHIPLNSSDGNCILSIVQATV